MLGNVVCTLYVLYNLNFIITTEEKYLFDHRFIHFADSGMVCNLLAQVYTAALVQSQDLNSSQFDFKDHCF